MTDSFENCIRSYFPGRLRARHASLKNAETVKQVKTFLAGLEGVRSVEINPRVGGLLLLWDPAKLDIEQLKALASAALPEEKPVPAKSAATRQRAPAKGFQIGDLNPFHGSKFVNQNVNRAMTATYALTLLGLVPGIGPGGKMALHVASGVAFTAFLAWHLIRYRSTVI